MSFWYKGFLVQRVKNIVSEETTLELLLNQPQCCPATIVSTFIPGGYVTAKHFSYMTWFPVWYNSYAPAFLQSQLEQIFSLAPSNYQIQSGRKSSCQDEQNGKNDYRLTPEVLGCDVSNPKI